MHAFRLAKYQSGIITENSKPNDDQEKYEGEDDDMSAIFKYIKHVLAYKKGFYKMEASIQMKKQSVTNHK